MYQTLFCSNEVIMLHSYIFFLHFEIKPEFIQFIQFILLDTELLDIDILGSAKASEEQ